MEDTSYAYLHCDLLDNTPLMTIIFKMKSPHIKMHEQYLPNGMYVREFFRIESKSKKGFEKGDMHVVITIESTIIVSSLFFNMS